MTAVWARLASVVLGVWLMAAPAALAYGDPARTSDRIVGPIVASLAFVAMWEVARGLRWANLLAAAWLLAAPWVLRYGSVETANNLAVGALLIGLAFVRGRVRGGFGGGWASLGRAGAGSPRAPR